MCGVANCCEKKDLSGVDETGKKTTAGHRLGRERLRECSDFGWFRMRLLEKKREEGMVLEKNLATGDGFFLEEEVSKYLSGTQLPKEAAPIHLQFYPQKSIGVAGVVGVAWRARVATTIFKRRWLPEEHRPLDGAARGRSWRIVRPRHGAEGSGQAPDVRNKGEEMEGFRGVATAHKTTEPFRFSSQDGGISPWRRSLDYR